MFIKDYKDAQLFLTWAKQGYEKSKATYEKTQKACEKAVTALDEQKIKIWASFSEFVDVYNKIKNKPPRFEGMVGRENIDLSVEDLHELQHNASVAVDFMADAAKSAVGGIVAGQTAVGAASVIGAVASMGLTWVGVPGGFAAASSMASCWMACYGLSVSPLAVIAAPAMLIGGLILNSSGKQKVEEAKAVVEKAQEAGLKFDTATNFVASVHDRCNDVALELGRLHDFYLAKTKQLQAITEKKTDYALFTTDEQYILASTIILVKLLKDILVLKLIDKQEDAECPVICQSDRIVQQIENSKAQRLELISKEGTLSDTSLRFVQGDVVTNTAETAKTESFTIDKSNRNIAVGDAVQIAGKHVHFKQGLHVEGKIEFIDCDLYFEKALWISIYLGNGTVEINDCRIHATAVPEFAHIVIEDGRLKIRRTEILSPVYATGTIHNNGTELQQCFINIEDCNEKAFLQMEDCTIDGGNGVFLFSKARAEAELTRCTIKNHKGTFLHTCDASNWDSSGVTLKNCHISQCLPQRRKKDSGGLVYEARENAVFVNDDGKIRCYETIFENIDNYLFASNILREERQTVLESCLFKNLIAKEVKRGKTSIWRDPELLRLVQNATIKNCIFENCEGISIANDCTAYMHKENIISDCTFRNYSGKLFFGHCRADKCCFEDSEMVLHIEGSNESGERYRSQLTNAVFTNCRAKESLVVCQSLFSTEGICVEIENCRFERCKAEEMIEEYIEHIGAFGRSKRCCVADTENITKCK